MIWSSCCHPPLHPSAVGSFWNLSHHLDSTGGIIDGVIILLRLIILYFREFMIMEMATVNLTITITITTTQTMYSDDCSPWQTTTATAITNQLWWIFFPKRQLLHRWIIQQLSDSLHYLLPLVSILQLAPCMSIACGHLEWARHLVRWTKMLVIVWASFDNIMFAHISYQLCDFIEYYVIHASQELLQLHRVIGHILNCSQSFPVLLLF